MNAAEKAWQKRKPLSNQELLVRYSKRAAKACRHAERAYGKLSRAMASFAKSRAEVKYLQNRLADIGEAIKRGEIYPPKKEKKKKAGRRIEL